MQDVLQCEHQGRDPDLHHMTTEVTERKPTPLPKGQLSVLLYLQLAEPITAHVMLPFIVQVSGNQVDFVNHLTALPSR